MSKPEKITLGQQEFNILPMNLATLEEVEDGFAALGRAEPGRERFQAYLHILLAGIQTCLPEYTMEALRKVPAVEKHQVTVAVDAIARVSGLAPQKTDEAAAEGKDPATSVSDGTN